MPQAPAAQAFKVFVVEDSPPLRERLLEMLGSIEGVTASGSADGSDAAVREILAARPDTVLLDLNLAQGSGFDVLRAVQETAPEVEVWMLTNFSSEPYRSVCRRLGAARFFDKTTEFEQVRENIAARAAHRNTH
jgi:DNA-binding NarL/FixJ family response regulator